VYIGAMLEEVPKEGEGLKIMGSAMMAHAATKEEVLEVIKQDIYFKSNVWNLDKVRLHISVLKWAVVLISHADPNLSSEYGNSTGNALG
jgi:hypothetical protein